VVRPPAKGYGTTRFDMTDEERDAPVAAGGQAMDGYLKARTGLGGVYQGTFAGQ
jgi:hypothetical protein